MKKAKQATQALQANEDPLVIVAMKASKATKAPKATKAIKRVDEKDCLVYQASKVTLDLAVFKVPLVHLAYQAAQASKALKVCWAKMDEILFKVALDRKAIKVLKVNQEILDLLDFSANQDMMVFLVLKEIKEHLVWLVILVSKASKACLERLLRDQTEFRDRLVDQACLEFLVILADKEMWVG